MATEERSEETRGTPGAGGAQAEERMRRARIERMARMARAYRGWNSRELLSALGRENTRVAPPSGIPRLDLVARLAQALDWDLGDVAERLWSPRGPQADDAALRAMPFAELDARAQSEHRAGGFADMKATGLAMRAIARTPRERAIAANRLAGAYDGEGRYERVLESVRAGLAERGIGADVRLMLTINLANVSYTLWNLHETRAIAEGVLGRWTAEAPRTRLERVGQAFARLLRGQSSRRGLDACESDGERAEAARSALADLRLAEEHYGGLFDDFGDPQYRALAHTARGAAIEARAAAGELAPEAALELVLEELDAFVDIEVAPSAHLVESAGWWAVFGANIAARTEGGAHERTIAICTNKAAEVSEHLGHWPMRERAFSLEWRRQVAARDAGAEPLAQPSGWTLDTDDLRALIGTMGRLPFFRPTGWAILDGAVLAT